MWAISAVVVDLPLVPVTPMKRALRAGGAHRAEEELDVPEDRDAGARGAGRRGMRLRKGVRDAGREHQGGGVGRNRERVGETDHVGRGCANGGIVVPRRHVARPRGERERGGKPVAAEPEHGETLTGENGRERRPAHRSFSVARPTIARIEEMIQKRMTIVGSAQPFFSK